MADANAVQLLRWQEGHWGTTNPRYSNVVSYSREVLTKTSLCRMEKRRAGLPFALEPRRGYLGLHLHLQWAYFCRGGSGD